VHLTDPRLWGLAAESRAFDAHRVAGRGPSSCEELRAVRAAAAAPAPADPPAVVEVVRAGGGRSIPVRIHAPVSGAVAGVHLQIHGGGFYLGSAAGDDVRNRELADALGLASSASTTGWPPNIPGLAPPTTARPRHFGSPSTPNNSSARRSCPSGASRPARPWQRPRCCGCVIGASSPTAALCCSSGPTTSAGRPPPGV